MSEIDWRQILGYSQKELQKADKDFICDGLSWMDVDDIDISFSDLKALFRLAQDMLKFKSEQVKDLKGQATIKRKKGKSKNTFTGSPTKHTEQQMHTINDQEELINTNKEIIEELQREITNLESRKNALNLGDKDNESSVCTLSEMNAVRILEDEISIKNKHIKILLADVKILEEDNLTLKDKVSILKEKLTEATKIINNLTEQSISMKNEASRLREILGNSEQKKSHLSTEIELLKRAAKEIPNQGHISEEIKSKIKHWKELAKSKKSELELATLENSKLKEELSKTYQLPPISNEASSTPSSIECERKIRELQEKLNEAADEIEHSTNIINALKAENDQLKSVIDETPDVVSESKNESDDGKQRSIIKKLRKKNIDLTTSLQEADEVLKKREKELSEVTAQLQLIHSDEGVSVLIEGLKTKKNQLKVKDAGIKSLVQEVNNLNQLITDLQLENETLRQKFNIPSDEKIYTKGILKKYHDLEILNTQMKNEIKEMENKTINLELNERSLITQRRKLIERLNSLGYTVDNINMIEVDTEVPLNDGGESLAVDQFNSIENAKKDIYSNQMQKIIDENEGLRKGLQELLDFLKDNSTTTSGILALNCPSLESILQKMEIRHTAGWFSPHMSTVMELEAARGGKDALLLALHEARKETFNLMNKLSHQSKVSSDLQKKLIELEAQNKRDIEAEVTLENELFEFGTWVTENETTSVDFNNIEQFRDSILNKNHSNYEQILKKVLKHFHDQFKVLYDKMNSVAIEMIDKNNNWLIQEEQYKAEIEQLKICVQQNEDEDTSNSSPGLITTPNLSTLERKCSYLEESYKYIRTLNENIRNENLECKKEKMLLASENEIKIQKLMLFICKITDKLRSSISLDLFWKQNRLFNEITRKYRMSLDENLKNKDKNMDLLKMFEDNKSEIIHYFDKQLNYNMPKERDRKIKEVEQLTLQKQLTQAITELEKKNQEIDLLERNNLELKQQQARLIDDTLSSLTVEEIHFMKSQLSKLTEENKLVKEQYRETKDTLDVATLQLGEHQRREMNKDIETNILRHQILDLQSIENSKAIVSRLSSELLVTHLQASEYNGKIQELTTALNKEKELRADVEEMLSARQKVFEVYSRQYELKFKYIYKMMDILRFQYQGSLPLISIESYLGKYEDLSRKNRAINDQLSEIDDLRSNLMTKHAVFDQILDISKDKCLLREDDCPHKLKCYVMEATHTREIDNMNKKVKISEQLRDELLQQCNELEKTLLLVNQAFQKASSTQKGLKPRNEKSIEIFTDDVPEPELDSRSSRTIILPKPQILRPTMITKATITDITNEQPQQKSTDLPSSSPRPKLENVSVQTFHSKVQKSEKFSQTDDDTEIMEIKNSIQKLKNENRIKVKELEETLLVAQKRAEQILTIQSVKNDLELKIKSLQGIIKEKDIFNEKLQAALTELQKQNIDTHNLQIAEIDKLKRTESEENKKLLSILKQLENDKNNITVEYKQLLYNEREEYSKAMKELQVKIMELQTKLDRKGSDTSVMNNDALKEIVNKYTLKIALLEDECFRLQSDFDQCKADKTTYRSEVERWKDLASERLLKMEQLNSQLEERHSQEVDSYKAENQHWLSQLNDTQKEHSELRSRLTEQKAQYIKQLAEKDAHIEHLRTVVHSLKTQIMNMQTMLSANDPSFDLSAIVEIEETSDVLSQTGSDRLEIKFDSTTDIHDIQEEMVKIPGSSTTIWQETIIERLRREKQLVGKQNAILRRQIKALAARERRARLDAQNLKNQVFRISTSGNKVATAEAAALHNKIGSLQAQLTNARRDTQNNVALWDKWKRAQQMSERWQAKYEEKCQDIKKLETHLTLTKSAVARLEKEKRLLMSRLSELKCNSELAIEKQENEPLEKTRNSLPDENTYIHDISMAPLISTQSLMDRIQAQQRRIAALELSEKGNEHLVSEYEKALAEITSLKGQVLKLESTLLESQIKSPFKTCTDEKPELEYWKSYCDMLKEENVQLNLRINSLETVPTTGHQHRVADLEQTVLTLRGLVSKLQAEQKTSGVIKRAESRPNSGKSGSEKNRTQAESYRIEIANLKRSIQDKDLLLERSKEMLKIAAEREDELLRENLLLRRRIEDLMRPKEGFLSA